MLTVKTYAHVKQRSDPLRNNIYLPLFRDVGSSKFFFADCIASALLELDVPVLMMDFPYILNRLMGVFSEGKADFITNWELYDLLIIDDLGMERNTRYAMEQMFHVIDSHKPMVITTNLLLEEINKTPSLTLVRISDRILKRCAPLLFVGKNFREEKCYDY